jgi:DNA-binding NtrC family response regulator
MSTGKRVLVIEDHDDSRRLLTRMLCMKGFEVQAYDHCEPAEQHLAACDVDIALLDVRMDGRRGDDFGRELRQRCPKAIIVFITGEVMLEPLKEAVADCFVMRKPIDSAVLFKLLECCHSKDGHGFKNEQTDG